MKKSIVVFVGVLGTTLLAQNQPPGTISQGGTTPPANNDAINQPSTAAGATFNAPNGTTYSVDQLAAQLRNLRAAVDQTLPMLTAFTETSTNSAGGKPSVANELSGLISGVLNRHTNTTAGTSTQTTATNLLSRLQTALAGNPSASAPANTLGTTATVQDFITLQSDLQPVEAVLQRLNVTSAGAGQFVAPGTSTNTPNGSLAPTGR